MLKRFVSLFKHRVKAFNFGKQSRRLTAIPATTTEINALIRTYGRTVVARSRHLCANNPYAAAAKAEFISAMVGDGIKPSPLLDDADQKAELQQLWYDWVDEADADGLSDFYGLQIRAAGELFEAGECFVRARTRRQSDGLTVPLQVQLIPAEMLDYGLKEQRGAVRIEMGIEFNAIGQRTAYHFLRTHPGTDFATYSPGAITVRVPASEVYHLYDPFRVGQIRGVPHTLSAMVTLAMLELYDDAELERKRTAALFGAFIRRPLGEDQDHPLGGVLTTTPSTEPPQFALEPGAIIDLEPGEDVTFSSPADVGNSYEAFQYRMLLRAATGLGVPYQALTGDLRQTSYGSMRGGMITFRRKIQAKQNAVLIFQFCRPIWQKWLDTAALAGVLPWTYTEHQATRRDKIRVKWQTPKWDWIDPYKDLQAEKLAVDSGFKSRSDVIEAEGYDPEETDARIAADREREDGLGLKFGQPAPAEAPPAVEDAPEEDPAPGDEGDKKAEEITNRIDSILARLSGGR